MSAKLQRQPIAQAAGLGQARGVASLFEDTTTPGTELEGARELPIKLIDTNPLQPRQAFDPQSLRELADSIGEHGVLEPIMVRPVGYRYQIVLGERRFRAAALAELEHMPAIIREMDDIQAAFASTVENLQREDLDIEDEARRFAFLLELTGVSQRKLAEKLGINHVYLSRRVKLLKRPDLLSAYHAGLMTLHQVVAQVDQVDSEIPSMQDIVSQGNSPGIKQLVEREDMPLAMESVSPGNSDSGEIEDLQLIKRADQQGYIVSRGNSQSDINSDRDGLKRTDGLSQHQEKSSGTPFRWRPTTQFRNWLNRVNPKEVPADERATLRAQITEIKSKLEEWEDALKE